MKSRSGGKSTLAAEVTQIDKQGIWVLIDEKESFLSFENFPWFRNAPVSAIHNVELLNTRHLHGRILISIWLSNRSNIRNGFRSSLNRTRLQLSWVG
ncbi:MAG TPA: hypothetical protein VEW46_00135 [Pyrinomonadaceae bacterium]|nr:hypothetical protein [Pyrinomonadaceae bacterium]